MGNRDDSLSAVDAVLSGGRANPVGVEQQPAVDVSALKDAKVPQDQGNAKNDVESVGNDVVRRYYESQHARLVFEKDDTTGKMVARLKDPLTGELIRQVPPEELLKVAESVNRYLGLLVDRKS
jgi:flagellar protein FlaG